MTKRFLPALQKAILPALLCLFPLFAEAAEDKIVIYESEGKQIQVDANQPLTPKIEAGLVEFLEWVYQKPLSASQKGQFHQELARTWDRDKAVYFKWLGLMIQARHNGLASAQSESLREKLKPVLATLFKPESSTGKLMAQLAGTETGKPEAPAAVPQVNFQGSYYSMVNEGAIGLHLEQTGGNVVGRLDGIKAAYSMAGALQQDGRIYGQAESRLGKLYFTAQKEGRQIKLLLAEPDANGNVNKDKMRLLAFTPGYAPERQARQQAVQAPAQPAIQQNQAGLPSTKQCSQAHTSCLTACSKVGGAIKGMNQCIDSRCTPAYQKCMGGRQPNVTAADRAWANQLSNTSAQIHQQQMQLYQQQIDSTNEFSRQQEERLRKERFGY